MDSGILCFSTTSILRCESTSTLKGYLLIIPPAIEVLFALTLLIAHRGKSRRHLWITAEGCIYFSLVLIEMLSRILPAARDHLDIFKVFNYVLAAASSVPIFCYIFFVFLFARAELIDILPRRSQMVSKFILLILIPVIVTLSELASFFGVSLHEGTTKRPTLYFPNDRDRNIWSFFTSLTLALLAAYQLMSFCLAFYRLVRAIITQRLIEVAANDETQFLRGTAWVALGLKLGEIETIIGFVENVYWSAMTRRILRMLARASLVIGLIKGLDTMEDFAALEDEVTSANRRRSFRGSRLGNFVSSPRLSTLRQLPPTAAPFHPLPRTPQAFSFPPLPESGLPTSPEVRESSIVGRRLLADRPNRERVTVQLENGIPKLRMRFSAFELPKFLNPTPNNRTYAAAGGAQKSRPKISISPDNTNSTPPPANAFVLPESPRVYPRYARDTPNDSLYSVPTGPQSPVESYTSLSTVRELASQFPPLPTRVLESIEHTNHRIAVDYWDNSPLAVPRASMGNTFSSRELVATPLTTGQKSSKATSATRYLDVTAPDSIATTPTMTVSGSVATPAMSMSTALTDEPYADPGATGGPMKSRSFGNDIPGIVAPRNTVDWIDFDAIPGSSLPQVTEEAGEGQSHRSQQSGSTESLCISWLRNSEEPQLAQAVSLKSQVARIKSIGSAPMRMTPRPVKNGHFRDSLHIERIHVPFRDDASNLENVRGSLRPSYDQSGLRDSDVLGMEQSNHLYHQHANNSARV